MTTITPSYVLFFIYQEWFQEKITFKIGHKITFVYPYSVPLNSVTFLNLLSIQRKWSTGKKKAHWAEVSIRQGCILTGRPQMSEYQFKCKISRTLIFVNFEKEKGSISLKRHNLCIMFSLSSYLNTSENLK